MTLRITDAARADADRISAEGLRLFGPVQTDIYLSDLGRALELIGEFPRLGTARPELGQDIYVRVFQSHLIFYQIRPEEIVITRIRHGREDWQDE